MVLRAVLAALLLSELSARDIQSNAGLDPSCCEEITITGASTSTGELADAMGLYRAEPIYENPFKTRKDRYAGLALVPSRLVYTHTTGKWLTWRCGRRSPPAVPAFRIPASVEGSPPR